MVIQFVLIPFVRKIIFVLEIIDIAFVIYWMYICLSLDKDDFSIQTLIFTCFALLKCTLVFVLRLH